MKVDVAAFSKFRAYFRNHDFPLILGLLLLYLKGFFFFFVIAAIRVNGGESADNNMRATIALLEGGPLTQTIRWRQDIFPCGKKFCGKKTRNPFFVCKTLKIVWNMKLITRVESHTSSVSLNFLSFFFLSPVKSWWPWLLFLLPLLLLLCQDKSSQFLDLWVEL